MSEAPLLRIENLRTYFYSRGRQAFIRSVDGVSFEIGRGETLGVVGESGSGKSITALSVLGLIQGGPGVIAGKIGFKTERVQKNLLQDLESFVRTTESNGRIMQVQKDGGAWRSNVERVMAGIRGREIAMIFQNPKASLNPFTSVGAQISEAIRLHTGIKDAKEARERALGWLDRVKIDSPRLRYESHPSGLSGGMCQRVMIAMALSSEPALLIADEPTTGLDATIQSKIVDLLGELKAELGITILLISHDIGVISRLSERVAVMYGGTVVEDGMASEILSARSAVKHPYTAALLRSRPSAEHIARGERLRAIEGEVLDTINVPRGCRFYERCDRVTADIRMLCAEQEPELLQVDAGHRVRCWQYVRQAS